MLRWRRVKLWKVPGVRRPVEHETSSTTFVIMGETLPVAIIDFVFGSETSEKLAALMYAASPVFSTEGGCVALLWRHIFLSVAPALLERDGFRHSAFFF